jgi:hypothetical protein
MELGGGWILLVGEQLLELFPLGNGRFDDQHHILDPHRRIGRAAFEFRLGERMYGSGQFVDAAHIHGSHPVASGGGDGRGQTHYDYENTQAIHLVVLSAI